jgi:SAM-dependent methyltransferase
MGDPSLKSTDSATPPEREVEPLIPFTCNICGRQNSAPQSRFDREVGSCDGCGSTVRTRAVVQMIARELFGMEIPLADFPVLKGIHGIGISDSPDYAERLAAKFSYRNTFYHKEPLFDIVNAPESEAGSYDFLIASEVFEHVAPPVEIAFLNAFRLLKPNGLFFFTVPYTLEPHTTEHFPELHDYGIARLSDGHVLVNRTRDGQVQLFQNLVFHGGGGETLEIRRFTENDLREQFRNAGFRELEIYGKNYAPFGILRTENWSLPMTARKDPFVMGPASVAELVDQSFGRARRLQEEAQHLKSKVAKYDEWIAWANAKMAEDQRELQERTQWALNLEAQLKERTEWAMILEKDVAHHVDLAKRFQSEALDKLKLAKNMHTEVEVLQHRLLRLQSLRWTKAGRLLRLVRE